MISIEAMLVTLCQLERWENFDNHHPEKLIKISKIYKENISGGVLL